MRHQRKLVIAIAGLLLALYAFASPVQAQYNGPGITVTVDGNPLSFDQPPAMIGGRVLVPLRGIFQSLGADVVYDGSSRSIHATRGSTIIDLSIGSRVAHVNGQTVMLDVPASEVGGRTLVPLRFISEAMGTSVKWDAGSRSVAISSPSGPSTGTPPSASYPAPSTTPEPSAAQPTISQVVLGSRGVLRTGDTLSMVMTGTPGGRALFDVMGARSGISMNEVSPGRYEGYLDITPGMTVNRGTVLAHLLINGQEAIKAADLAISINTAGAGNPGGQAGPGSYPNPGPDGGQLFVRVSTPRQGDTVRRDFEVVGRTQPYAQVTVQATVQRSLIPGLININGQTVTGRGRADANGNFRVVMQLTSVSNNRGSLDLTVQATDRAGNTSQQVQFNVAVGP